MIRQGGEIYHVESYEYFDRHPGILYFVLIDIELRPQPGRMRSIITELPPQQG